MARRDTVARRGVTFEATSSDDPVERYRLAGALFHELVELDAASRARRLATIAREDPALGEAVSMLLDGDQHADACLPARGFGLTLVPQEEPDPRALLGTVIGRFRICDLVGQGGAGVVYRANDTILGREVALKFPRGAQPGCAWRPDAMLAEARAASALDHPNLCPIYEIGESPYGPWLAMPLYRGETLKQRLQRIGRLEPDEVLALLTRLADGLAHIHDAGLAHGDLTPANVMLVGASELRLLDFGMARAVAPRAAAPALRGTLAYMAPELFDEVACDSRTDLWSLGVLLHEVLTGERPFRGDDDVALVRAIRTESPPTVDDVVPGIPAVLTRLVDALLTRDRDGRLHSARDVLSRLHEVNAGTDQVPGASTVPKRRPRAAAMVIGAAALGAAWAQFASTESATLIGRGVLKPHDQIILAEVVVEGPDSASAPALTTLLRRAFEDGPLPLLSPAQQAAALSSMRRPADTPVSTDLARELGEREGAAAVLAARIEPLANGARVTLELLTPRTGALLASTTEEAPLPERDLIPALLRAERELRGRIGTRDRNLRYHRPATRRLTTTSLRALRLVNDAGSLPRAAAIGAVQEALTLDSTFAYAWLILGDLLGGAQARSLPRDHALRTAYRLRDQLSDMERVQVSSFYWNFVERDGARARQLLADAFARDSLVWRAVPLNLADWLLRARRFAEAESLARRLAPRADIGHRALIPLLDAELAQGRWQVADSIVRAISNERGAMSAAALVAARRVALSRLDFIAADTLLSRLLQQSTAPDFWAAETELALLRLRGDTSAVARAEARRDASRAVIANAAGVRLALDAERQLDHARMALWHDHDPRTALTLLDRVAPALVGADPLNRRLLQLDAAAVRAAAGDPPGAQALVRAAEQGADSTARRAMFERHHAALGEIALAEGRYVDAMTAFRRSDHGPDGFPSTACAVCVLPHLARVAERAGWADSARRYWTAYADTPSVERLTTDQWFLRHAYLQLGRPLALTAAPSSRRAPPTRETARRSP